MKFLIWFSCFFLNAIITVLINRAGFLLGGLPTALLFLGSFMLAKTLSKKWDESKKQKKETNDKLINLTKDVHAVTTNKERNNMQYHSQEHTTTDEDILIFAQKTNSGVELTEEEKDMLDIFKKQFDDLEELCAQRFEQNKIYREHNDSKDGDDAVAMHAKTRMDILDKQIEKARKMLFEIQQKSALLNVLKKARPIFYQDAAELVQEPTRDLFTFARKFGMDFDSMLKNTVYPLDKERYNTILELNDPLQTQSFANFFGFKDSDTMFSFFENKKTYDISVFFQRYKALQLKRIANAKRKATEFASSTSIDDIGEK